jgi:hypothetical protein
MNKPTEPEPMVRMTPEGAALGTAALCMGSFGAMVWPIGRMWNAPVRDWEMLAPAFGLQAFLAVFAFVAVARYLVLARRDRAGRAVPLAPLAPARTGRTAEARTEVAPAEPFVFSYAYPEPPASLGRPFWLIMDLIGELPFRGDDVLAQLDALWAQAQRTPGFANAESFIISKVERRQDYRPDFRSAPADPDNVAVYVAMADEVHPYAAIVAGMVLVADELPEQVWDLLAGPWEDAGLNFPQVVLAG